MVDERGFREKKRLVISESLEETVLFGLRFKAPKSGQVRVIPIADSVIPLLRDHQARQKLKRNALGAGYQDNDLVFCNPDGTPWAPNTFTKDFASLVKQVGAKGFRFHDLRHGFATLTLNNGTPVKEVSTLLGHSTETVTLSTYAHLVEGVARDAINGLAGQLLPAKKGTSVA
ncbi:MAG: site-specific integrase [bacterium]|nr:site-specific integrase [bacterium]